MSILVPIIIGQGIVIASRAQRAAATVQQSTRQAQLAFRIFMLEYGLKFLMIIIGLILMTLNSKFKESLDEELENATKKAKQTSILKSTWMNILSFAPIVVGWGLRKTLNELRRENAPAPVQQQLEEQGRQLYRVRSWPRITVGSFTLLAFGGVIHSLATAPSDTQGKSCRSLKKWYSHCAGHFCFSFVIPERHI